MFIFGKLITFNPYVDRFLSIFGRVTENNINRVTEEGRPRIVE